VIASFLIVWYHSHIAGYKYAYSGLVAFLFLSGYLWAISSRKPIKLRAKRLLIPWMFWFSVYGIYNLYKGRSLLPDGSPLIFSLLAGPNIHLWYLPFLFLSLILLDQIRGRLAIRPDLTYFVVALVLLAISISGEDFFNSTFRPLPQYIFGFPALVLGAIWGMNTVTKYTRFGSINQHLLVVWPFAMGIFICFCAYLLSNKINYLAYMIGMIILVPAWLWKDDLKASYFLDQLASASLGIYLIHPLCLNVLNHYGVASGIVLVLLAYLISLLIIVLFRLILPKVSIFVV
jgi:fucose 4-O-acetylase-like acetyltransferase